MADLTSREIGPSLTSHVEAAKLVVSQPKKLETLLQDLSTIESFTNRVSERTGEDRSGDLGGAGAGSSTDQGDDQQISARDQAIAAMPTSPLVLQKKLQDHVQEEMTHLRKMAKKTARASRPGDAFRLNQIYARIRRLNALLLELVEATLDMLHRLYIRVFVDKQPII
ncbi:MAG: hypothetical protein WCV62_04835 [Candidatus Peribacteraceae bacterium]|jgi:hypothetical protein